MNQETLEFLGVFFCRKVGFAGVALEALLRRVGGSVYFGDRIIEQETDSIPHDYALSYYYRVLEKSGEMNNARRER